MCKGTKGVHRHTSWITSPALSAPWGNLSCFSIVVHISKWLQAELWQRRSLNRGFPADIFDQNLVENKFHVMWRSHWQFESWPLPQESDEIWIVYVQLCKECSVSNVQLENCRRWSLKPRNTLTCNSQVHIKENKNAESCDLFSLSECILNRYKCTNAFLRGPKFKNEEFQEYLPYRTADKNNMCP